MSYDDDWSDDLDDLDEDDSFDCPECGAEIHAETESCPACGYWITDAEREAGWRAGAMSDRIRAIGLWMIAIAAIGVLVLWWRYLSSQPRCLAEIGAKKRGRPTNTCNTA